MTGGHATGSSVPHTSQTSSTGGSVGGSTGRNDNIAEGSGSPSFSESRQASQRLEANAQWRDDEDRKKTSLGNAVAMREASEAGSVVTDYAGPVRRG